MLKKPVGDEAEKKERIQRGMAALNIGLKTNASEIENKRKNIYKEIADQLKQGGHEDPDIL